MVARHYNAALSFLPPHARGQDNKEFNTYAGLMKVAARGLGVDRLGL